jgi:hypothetical protein
VTAKSIFAALISAFLLFVILSVKIVYRTKNGIKTEELRQGEFQELAFESGVKADEEHLKAHAKICNAHIELLSSESLPSSIRKLIPVKLTKE